MIDYRLCFVQSYRLPTLTLFPHIKTIDVEEVVIKASDVEDESTVDYDQCRV